MRTHFSRKSLCTNKNNLELTDEIKQIVLRDHIYHSNSDFKIIESTDDEESELCVEVEKPYDNDIIYDESKNK